MEGSLRGQSSSESGPTGGRRFLWAWSVGLVLLGVIAGGLVVQGIARHRRLTHERYQARVDPLATEPGKTEAELSAPPGHESDSPLEVRVGLYLDRIVEVSIKESSWTADFYLWFNWTGEAFHPGDTLQVVDGRIESMQLIERIDHGGPDGHPGQGQRHYALYRVQARITRFFDVARFPCDDHLLTINLEDTAHQSYAVRFVADEAASDVSSRVQVTGYRAYRHAAIVKPHSYRSARGNPDLPPRFKATYSQFVFAVWIARPDLGFFIKLFLGLYVAVAVALLALFVRPTYVDPRFGLGVGALFAAVANDYVVSTLLPDTGVATLTDVVNGLGLALVFVTLVQSAISLHLYDGRSEQALSRRFDRVSFVVLTVIYVVINVTIPCFAIRP